MLNLSVMKGELKNLQASIKRDQAIATALMAFLNAAGESVTATPVKAATNGTGKRRGRPAGSKNKTVKTKPVAAPTTTPALAKV